MKLVMPADVAHFRIPSEAAAAPTLIFANTGSPLLTPSYRGGLREPRIIVQNKISFGAGRDAGANGTGNKGDIMSYAEGMRILSKHRETNCGTSLAQLDERFVPQQKAIQNQERERRDRP